MAYIWINPVVDRMYEPETLNTFLARHGHKRLYTSGDWLGAVKEKYRLAVEQSAKPVMDVRCPKVKELLEELEGLTNVVIPEIKPILIHCGDSRYEYSAPKKIANLHRDFPNLMILAAHLGGYERWNEAEEYLAGLENVKYDTCSSLAFMSPERAAELIRRYGVENCFYGSDFPMWRHEDEFRNILSLGFTEVENRRIFAENFKECMGIK